MTKCKFYLSAKVTKRGTNSGLVISEPVNITGKFRFLNPGQNPNMYPAQAPVKYDPNIGTISLKQSASSKLRFGSNLNATCKFQFNKKLNTNFVDFHLGLKENRTS